MKICFIINPVSGKHSCPVSELTCYIQTHVGQAPIHLTQGPAHATALARQAADAGYEAVVAVGGDGTINETARGLIGTKTALAIVPHGSGNGLARELGISLSFKKAIAQIKQASPQPCDIGYANKELFLNLAGVGLEAQIAWQFMEHGKTGSRGKWPYFKLATQTIFSYKPPLFEANIAGKQKQFSPLTLVFANGRQYGSNFKIAPHAKLNDGLLDMVFIPNLSIWKLALALPGFFTGKGWPVKVSQTTAVKHVILTSPQPFPYHIDGEPRMAQGRLEITLAPQALNILFPEH